MTKQPWLLITYPKCSTCQKAKKYLDAHGIAYEERHIIEETPSALELQEWMKLADFPLTKLWNTSGKVYRSLQLKTRIPTMSEAETYRLLASNGMLIKRPLLVGRDCFLVGFHETQWQNALKTTAK